MIQLCGCKSEYQDKVYGKGMRVFNLSGKNPDVATCTVCGNKKGVSQEKKEEVPKKKK